MAKSGRRSLAATMALLCLAAASRAESADLSFEQRVAAQLAIERVYYAHQLGVDKAFETLVPRATVEQKVARYLAKSRLLAHYWQTPVTDAMLRAEIERMQRDTRMPDRLRELFSALGDDPLVIAECLARPLLVDRMAARRFDEDPGIHGARRSVAEIYRERRNVGAPLGSEPLLHASVVEIVTRGERCVRPASAGMSNTLQRVELPAEDFDAWRARLPRHVGEISAIADEEGSFVFRVLLADEPGLLRFANHAVPKRTWEEWWNDRGSRTPLDCAVARSRDSATASPTALPVDERRTRSQGALDASGPAYTPASRYSHTAVWTGNRMIIWGGFNGTDLNTGGQYDPATDSWSALTTEGAPTARHTHTAVWTGSLMIVWGPYDGARYDPVAESWSQVTTVSSPTGPYGHTAVWADTVRKMIIWGGGTTTVGGAYDPDHDSWVPLSAEGAPSIRSAHTAVWTGNRMIVWGGWDYSPTYQTATGAIYDPETDHWTPMAMANVPSARSGHVAVWADLPPRMLVWGGTHRNAETGVYEYVEDGGAYDAVNDSWAPITADGAPHGRYAHSAVWAQNRMIVWGGRFDPDGYAFYNTGGRFDPVAQSWQATTIADAPSRRQYHTAVWTGARMIVWGGANAAGYTNTGGSYDPQTDRWTPTRATDEICDDYDNDGDGTVDEGCDDDRDGYCDLNMTTIGTPPICPHGGGDCEDDNATRHPGPEVCDGLDNQCVGAPGYGLVDEGCDDDGDGYCDAALTTIGTPPVCPHGGTDCDDRNAAIHPTATEACNGRDDDCDGTTDEAVNLDHDGDTWTVCQGDCNDDDRTIHPHQPDDCTRPSVDVNCDGVNALESSGIHGALFIDPDARLPVTRATVDLYHHLSDGSVDPNPEGHQQRTVGPASNTFDFACLPQGVYDIVARIEWTDTMPTANGTVTDVRETSKSYTVSIGPSQARALQDIVFPRPVVLVYGRHGGACLPERGYSCSNDPCSQAATYWTSAYNELVRAGYVTLVAHGMEPCDSPDEPQRPGSRRALHDWNATRLQAYLQEAESGLAPLVGSTDVPVDIVAHSMGGLTARALISGSANELSCIRTLVELGTPNAGSRTAELANTRLAHGVWYDGTAPYLTRRYLYDFNQRFGNRRSTVFFAVAGSGGSSSSDASLLIASNIEPHPNDGIVSRQSVVDYDVPDSPLITLDHYWNRNFREADECWPGHTGPNCLTKISPASSLCTDDDHGALISTASTLNLVRAVLERRTSDYVGSTCGDGIAKLAASDEPEECHLVRRDTGNVLPNGVANLEHLIDSSQESRFELHWTTGDLSLSLQDPSGRRIDPGSGQADPRIRYVENHGANRLAAYIVSTPLSGPWTLIVQGSDSLPAAGSAFVVMSTSVGRASVTGNINSDPIALGASAVVMGRVAEGGTPIIGAHVTATVSNSDGTIGPVECRDDGLAPDLIEGDAIYSCPIDSLTSPGVQSAEISVDGTRSDGIIFHRTDVLLFTVTSTGAALNSVFADSAVDSNADGVAEDLAIDIGISITQAGDYSVEGELVDQYGGLIERQSVLAESQDIGTATLTLRFSGTVIRSHGVAGPYVLTRLRLRRADSDLAQCEYRDNAWTTAAYLPTDFAAEDSDGDGIPNVDDNCPRVFSPDQADADHDGVGDVCDNCPFVMNSDQRDGDRDGFGDLCDLCISARDFYQSDTDHDGLGDSCDPDADGDGVPNEQDCVPLDPRVWSAPNEVTGLTIAQDRTTVSWIPLTVSDTSTVSYDVVKGRVSQLQGLGSFDDAICIAQRSTNPSVLDAFDPETGNAFYYLARARTGCGTGTYGIGSHGARPVVGCP